MLRLLAGASASLLTGCGARLTRQRVPGAGVDWTSLQATVQGQVIPRGRATYENRRQSMVWNARKSERFPDALVCATSEADVCEAIRFARRNDLPVALRGGGHNWHNAALRHGGLLLDLSGLSILELDAGRRSAVVEPGVTGSALMARLGPSALAFPIGHCPAVPMSGFLLNGGLGWNYRLWGPSCANITAIDMVNAQGELIRADAEHHADLFWAARGAGPGFFGVVTRFHLGVHALPGAILKSTLIYGSPAIDAVAASLSLLAPSLPAQVELSCNVYRATRGDRGLRLAVNAIAYGGTVADARAALRALVPGPGEPQPLEKSLDEELSWQTLFGVADPGPDEGPRYAGDALWSNAPLPRLLSRVRDQVLAAPSQRSFMLFWIAGAPSLAGQPYMAYSQPASTYVGAYTMWNYADEDSANRAWVRGAISSLEPLIAGGYVGETDLAAGPGRARQCFSVAAWDRLIQLKRQHDPENRFFSYLEHEEPA